MGGFFRRGTHRLDARIVMAWQALICLCGLALGAPAMAIADSPTRFDIAAQPLTAALKAYAAQAKVQLLYSSVAVGAVTGNAVVGEFDKRDALERLLKDTGLEAVYSGNDRVTIRAATPAAPPTSGAHEDRVEPSRFRVARADTEPTDAAEIAAEGAAEGNSVKLEEIVVTAQKRAERLQDVPVPVTAIRASTLVANNQLRIQDFASSVPGFSASPSPSAGGQQQLAVRGISTGFNTNPTVGVTVDDVPYGASTNLVGNSIPDIDPNDLSHVEVLRGPQGTLYGASSMGGLLKFVTVDPSPGALSGRVEIGANGVKNGDGPGYSARGSANVPLGDTSAMRVSAFYRGDAGYIDNPVLGRDGVNEAHVKGGRLAFLWKPSDAVSLKLSALAQTAEGDGTNDIAVLPELGDLEQNYVPNAGAYERRAQALSATLTARLGRSDLTVLSGYNDTDFKDSFDFSYLLGPFFNAGVPVFTHNEAKKFSQEIRLSTPLGEKVDWLVGAFYTHENTPQAQDVRTEDPTTGELGASLLSLRVPTKYDEYALFSDVTFRLTDRFDLQIGGRGSRIRHSASETQSGPLAGPATPNSTSKDNAFTYLVTPRFRINPDVMLYARFASGYRAGGPNGNSDPSVPRSYEPDTTQTYELGWKAGFVENRVVVDASLYYIKWDKIQLNLVAPNAQTYTTNGEQAKSEGIELSVETRPLSGLRVAAWAVYNNAELTDSIPAGRGVIGESGDRLPYGSRVSGNLAIDQEFPLAGSFVGTIGGSLNYIGDRYGTFIGTPDRQRFPAYARLDLRAGVGNDIWNANLFVTNLADRRGILGGGAGTFPPYSFSVITPRTIGVSLSRSF
jgi:outer membrane receptor protein involved in Fe transport